jgi:hypothetical protein
MTAKTEASFWTTFLKHTKAALICSLVANVNEEKKQLEGEDIDPEAEENAPIEINTKLCPDSTILITASESYSHNLLGKLTEEHVKGTHYTFSEYERRLKIWKGNNYSQDDTDVLKDFFDQWHLKYIQVNVGDTLTDHFKSMRVFVERNGKFVNYQTAEDSEEHQRLIKQQEIVQEKIKKHAEIEKKEKEEEIERLKVQKEELRLKMIKLRDDDKKMLDEKTAYLR